MGYTVTEKLNAGSSRYDQSWRRYYTRVLQVDAGSDRIGPGTAVGACGLFLGQHYNNGTEQDFGSYLMNIEAKPAAEDRTFWEVVCEYGPYDPTQFPANPVDRQPEISWEYQRYQEPAILDANGNPVMNSAGDYFDPPVLKDFRRPILKLVRNESNFDAGLAYLYHDKVNANSFFGAGPGIVKVEGITPQRVFNPDYGWYWVVTYEFLFDWRTQDPVILNQGFRYLDKLTGKRLNVLDESGAPVSAPVWLDNTGQVIDPTGTPITLQFQIYDRVDFSFLNFDAFYESLVAYSTPSFQGFSTV